MSTFLKEPPVSDEKVFFMVLGCFFYSSMSDSMVFHGSRLVFMVVHSSRSVFMVPGRFFMVSGWFSWFFVVPG